MSTTTAAQVIEPQDGDTRRERMIRWILDRPELDALPFKGKVLFHMGRQAGSGQAEVSFEYTIGPERI